MTDAERNREYQRRWATLHPERNRKMRAEIFARQYIKPHGRAIHLVNCARQKARRAGHACSITKEWALERILAGKCEVSGLAFELSVGGGKGTVEHPFSPSICRMGTGGDYTPETCKVVVHIYTRALWGFDPETLMILCRALVQQ